MQGSRAISEHRDSHEGWLAWRQVPSPARRTSACRVSLHQMLSLAGGAAPGSDEMRVGQVTLRATRRRADGH